MEVKKDVYPYLVLSALCILFGLRAFFGFDWSDETYYAALTYRFVLGDPVFESSWDIHQFSAIITFPLVYSYKAICGSMDGIILFLRLIYVLLIAVISVISYKILKKHINRMWALTASVLILFSPFGIRTLSYNTIPIFCFFVAFLALINNQQRMTTFPCLISGFFTALGVMAYPSAVIVVLCFFLYFFLMRKKVANTRKGFFVYFIGLAVLAILFLAFLLYNSSVSNFLNNFHHMFADPEHQQQYSFSSYFIGIAEAFGFPIILMICFLTLAAIIYPYVKSLSRQRILGRTILVLSLSTLVIYIIITIQQETSIIKAVTLLMLAIPAFAPILFFMNNRKWHFSILLYFIGVFFSIAVSIGSNNGITGYSYPFLLSTIATIIYSSTIWSVTNNFSIVSSEQLLRRAKANSERKKNVKINNRTYTFTRLTINKSLNRIAVLPIMMFIGLLLLMNFNSVYRDSPISELTAKMTKGPASGLYTTPEGASKYGDIISAIDTYMPKSGTNLFVKLLPFGYLCSDALPATPRLWRTNLNYTGFEEYYNETPSKIPDAIFVVDEHYGIENGNVTYNDYYKKYLSEHEHEKYITKAGIIYQFLQ